MKTKGPLRPSSAPTHVQLCAKKFPFKVLVNRTGKASTLMKLIVYQVHSPSVHKQIDHIIEHQMVASTMKRKTFRQENRELTVNVLILGSFSEVFGRRVRVWFSLPVGLWDMRGVLFC